MSNMKHAKKRPHTLKERIRSKLWDFLMEDPPAIMIPVPTQEELREISQRLSQAGRITIDDSGAEVQLIEQGKRREVSRH